MDRDKSLSYRGNHKYYTTSRTSRGKTYSKLKKLSLQTFVCILIFSALSSINHINHPAIHLLKTSLSYNISSQDITNKILNLSHWITNIKFKNLEQTKGTQQTNLASNSLYTVYSMPPKVYPHFDDNYGAGNIDYSHLRQHIKKLFQTNVTKTAYIPKNNIHVKPQNLIHSRIILAPICGKMSISSRFGERIHPIKKTMMFHRGIDIRARSGDIIRAAAEGKVIEASIDRTYGRYIKILHNSSLQTLYAHCSKLLVHPGQKVKAGTTIGKVGATGSAIGPHLHFELITNHKYVNPLNYIKVKSR